MNRFPTVGGIVGVPQPVRAQPLSQPQAGIAKSSTHICPYCGQGGRKRKYNLFGPFNERQCRGMAVHDPKRSNHPMWKKLGLAWLISVPSPPDPNGWYEVHFFATCQNKKCPEWNRPIRLHEYEYCRQFGKLRLLIVRIQLWLGGGSFTRSRL